MNSENYTSIIVKIIDNIALITINRPDKLNALNKIVKTELMDVLERLEHDPNVKVIILTGAGEKAFIAGDDISEFLHRTKADFELLQCLTLKIERLKKPVIASINGYALGGGLEVALACDFRIASENSKFGFPEINLGLIPGAGGTQRLPKLIDPAKALELLMTGNFISATTAKEIGLINHISKSQELQEFTLNFAKKIAEKSALALEFAKKAVNYASQADIESGLKQELDFVWKLKNTPESEQKIKAFLKKR
ncbi:MAG: enoyl-CoA hydratase/isomerase family protein [Candidatus Helarchaeota archaeon]